MCLIVKKIRHLNNVPKIAKRNIPCFKVLWLSSTGQLATPYQETPITVDVLGHGLYADFLDAFKNGEIDHGIHSFKKAKQAFEVITSTEIVVRAYIPKGTKY